MAGALSLLAEAVEGAADDPPAVRRFAVRTNVESARLTDLVGQIIELSRLQVDDPLLDPEAIEVDDVLLDAVDRCQVDADRHPVTLTVAGTSGARILGSSRQLGVAVGNLVENAVVYSDPGARVVVASRVRPRSNDDYVEITVSDNGIGMTSSQAARVFERFSGRLRPKSGERRYRSGPVDPQARDRDARRSGPGLESTRARLDVHHRHSRSSRREGSTRRGAGS